MSEILIYILLTWLALCVASLVLISYTINSELYFHDIRKFLIAKNIFEFSFRLVIIFAYLPFNIISLIKEINGQ